MIERQAQLEKLSAAEEQYEEKMKLAQKKEADMISNARQTTATLMKESEIIAREKATAIKNKAKAQALAILE